MVGRWRSEHSMRIHRLLSMVCVLVSFGTQAEDVRVLAYADIVAEAKRLEHLEGSEYRISNQVLFKRVRLQVQSPNANSEMFKARPGDNIAFTCVPAVDLTRTGGGAVEGTVLRHAPSTSGEHLFSLEHCSIP